jgi:hypothetical protein
MSSKPQSVAHTQTSDAIELFTPRQMAPMPGQDPDRCEAIFRELCAHFKPRDPIECMWVNDVASLTSRIEFTRNCHRAVTLVSLRREFANNLRFTGDIALYERDEVRAQIYSEECDDGLPPGPPVTQDSPPLMRLLGAVSMGSLRREEDFMGLDFAAMRERDRIISQIARKRREDMIAAVKVIDMQAAANDVAD